MASIEYDPKNQPEPRTYTKEPTPKKVHTVTLCMKKEDLLIRVFENRSHAESFGSALADYYFGPGNWKAERREALKDVGSFNEALEYWPINTCDKFRIRPCPAAVSELEPFTVGSRVFFVRVQTLPVFSDESSIDIK